MNAFERAQQYNADNLSSARVAHINAVESEVISLANYLGITGNKDDILTPVGGLRLAALLHDCTKEKSLEINLKLCRECDIMLSDDDLLSPSVIHGKSASGIASRDYGLAKPYCDAIFYHTTGRADMTVIEKILYIADYIEPGRDYGDCREARSYFYKNAELGKDNSIILDMTVLFSLERTIASLKAKGRVIHPDSLAAHSCLSEALARENRK